MHGFNLVVGRLNYIYIFNTTILFTDVKSCRSSPCKNGGMCKNLKNDYLCSCIPAYTGKNCDKGFNHISI